MTAKEFLEIEGYMDKGNPIDLEDVPNLMITFAKHHVREALKAALEDIPYGGSDDIHYDDVKHILTESYPLKNIV